MAIIERLKTMASSYGVAERNVSAATSMAQTGEDAVDELTTLVGEMRDLAVAALTSTDRAALDAEYAELASEIDRISASTSYNGTNLLDGTTSSVSFQVGVGTDSSDRFSMTLADLDTGSLSLTGTSVATTAGASTTITALDNALNSLNLQRAHFGAALTRLDIAQEHAEMMQANLEAQRVSLQDIDVAAETAENSRLQVLYEGGLAVMAQANLSNRMVLTLLGSG